MKLLLITQNVGSVKQDVTKRFEEIVKEYNKKNEKKNKKISIEKIDIIVVCRQEVNGNGNDTFIDFNRKNDLYNPSGLLDSHYIHRLNKSSRQNITIDIYTKKPLTEINENLTEINKNLNLKNAVQFKKTIIQAKQSTKGTLLHKYQSAFGKYSKGAVFADITYGDKKIRIVNAHLPMDATKEGLGLKYRTKKFLEISQNAEKTDANYTFLTGDLNFRIDDPVHKRNQLNGLLMSHVIQNVAPNDKKFYTCKFKTPRFWNRITKRNTAWKNNGCRKQIPVNKINSGDPQMNKSCFTINRIPSRCDRILTIGNPIEPIVYENLVLSEKYDHNGIMAIFEFKD